MPHKHNNNNNTSLFANASFAKFTHTSPSLVFTYQIYITVIEKSAELHVYIAFSVACFQINRGGGIEGRIDDYSRYVHFMYFARLYFCLGAVANPVTACGKLTCRKHIHPHHIQCNYDFTGKMLDDNRIDYSNVSIVTINLWISTVFCSLCMEIPLPIIVLCVLYVCVLCVFIF